MSKRLQEGNKLQTPHFGFGILRILSRAAASKLDLIVDRTLKVRSTRSRVSSLMSLMLVPWKAALLTSTSMRPYSSTVFCTTCGKHVHTQDGNQAKAGAQRVGSVHHEHVLCGASGFRVCFHTSRQCSSASRSPRIRRHFRPSFSTIFFVSWGMKRPCQIRACHVTSARRCLAP